MFRAAEAAIKQLKKVTFHNDVNEDSGGGSPCVKVKSTKSAKTIKLAPFWSPACLAWTMQGIIIDIKNHSQGHTFYFNLKTYRFISGVRVRGKS